MNHLASLWALFGCLLVQLAGGPPLAAFPFGLFSSTRTSNTKWDPFQLINEQLVGREASEDSRANLGVANELLAAADKQSANNPKDKIYLEALVALAALAKVDESNICQQSSERLLERLTEVMKEYTKNPLTQLDNFGRPKRILINFLQLNAFKCHHQDYFHWGSKKIHFRWDLTPTQEYTVSFDIEEGFARLNMYLESKGSSMSLDENFKAVEETWADLKRLGVQHDAYLEALEQFLSLKQLHVGQKRCLRAQSKLAADFQTLYRKFAPDPYHGPKSQLALSKLVRFIFRDRGAPCMNEYALEWHKKEPEFRQLHDNFDILFDKLIDGSDCKFNEKFTDQRVEDLNCAMQRAEISLEIESVVNEADGSLAEPFGELNGILFALTELRENGHRRRGVFGRRSLTRDLNEFIVRPCKTLLDSKAAKILENSLDTARSVHMTDYFVRLAANRDPIVLEQVLGLVEWTNFYALCKRITQVELDRLVNSLILITEEATEPDETSE